ncbi:MAG: hypothetical protein NZ920_00585 [Aigarchaeota archaeon]|nr:hypothetical protein [Aigarchaeota archaeon]MDW8092939.1 DNA primase small subunit domain-containing protein [Nitrososphaerota archaeon]
MSFNTERDASFVKRAFSSYYRNNRDKIAPPTSPANREYAYFQFGEKVMVRHLAFSSEEEVRDAIVKNSPLHAYRSAAYYKYPSAPMEEKEWMGTDLVFDIDADHIPSDCSSEHEYRICKNCGTTADKSMESCGRCKSRLYDVEWVCERCLNGTKNELMKLIDVLIDDFGVSEDELEVAFSGNRGYHLVVYSSDYVGLDQLSRREIVNYLTARGLEPSYLGIPSPVQGKKGRPRLTDYPPPDLRSFGWRGRIIRRIYQFLIQGDQSTFRDLKNIGEISTVWSAEPDWNVGTAKQWRALSEAAAKVEGVNIDPVVTQDLHRLLRLSGTLNGKTGLLTKRLSIEDVSDFDPLRDSIALDDEPVPLTVFFSPRFSIGEVTIDEVREPTKISLPRYAAVYLICKGLASLVA